MTRSRSRDGLAVLERLRGSGARKGLLERPEAARETGGKTVKERDREMDLEMWGGDNG